MSFQEECDKADRRRGRRVRRGDAEHEPGCACWPCVMRLHSEAAWHAAVLKVRNEVEPF